MNHVNSAERFSVDQIQLISVFQSRTSLGEVKAIDYLRECEWDLAVALKNFEVDGAREEMESMTPSTSREKVSKYGELGSKKLHTPGYAFCLPNLESLAPDFRNFLEKDLIETSTQKRLEASGHLNWWHQYGQKLYPLSTTGDGNCLLHAASLGMWGLHDRQLTLREALYEMLKRGSRRTALWRRWKWAEHHANQASGLSLTLSDEEWMQEWNSIVALASPIPRKTDDSSSDSTDQIYESLEAIHVFALSHVLKRPIIVVSDTVLRNAKGEELSPVSFGGIYLPLECPSKQCHRSPLVLCYDSAHFSPLVPMRHCSSQMQIIPITDFNRNLLPVQFVIDPGPDFSWWSDEEDASMAARLEMTDGDKMVLLSEYMDLVKMDVRRGSVKKTRPIKSVQTSLEKSMTLASSGVAGCSQEKKRIFNEITQQFLRTFRLTTVKNKESGIDARMCATDLSRASCVIASRLVPSSHEYMEEMVREYMRSARERFLSEKQPSNVRKRISRSFSASSLMINCINQYCGKPASQTNNFLCRECFEHQKEQMASFNCENPHLLKCIPTAAIPTTLKSTTMPIITNSKPRVSHQGLHGDEHTVIPRTAPILGVTKEGMCTTTSISAVEGDNGVTHYYVSEEDPLVHISSPSHSSCAASQTVSSIRIATMSQLAS
ncbi:OTU-like cysteine protease [Dictyocaulus viviparus]|uniref:ubiquitinyl hydrolase 1 n=1 Tax=Dictyocaulus viviparus TaxID=29172 RepID=A0A0D8Y6Q5_DICVI|nr:OTU-like cysteine protease [Dictyocaulus viviparus]